MESLPFNLVLDEVDSTNAYARKVGESGAPHGSWVSARSQSSGRGRQGRQWESLEGNLFLSMILRLSRDFPLTWVPLSVALAVHRVSKRTRPDLDLVVKWPNDLGIRDGRGGFKKIGGILCEGVGGADGGFVIAGVGLNCARAPTTDQPTAALESDVDALREEVIDEVLAIFRLPIESLREEYASVSLLRSGDAIEWSDLKDATVRKGIFRSYGYYGELCAEESDSKAVRALFSEEIRLRKN